MYAMFSYDVPDQAKVGCPAYQMRRLGFRINLSVWIVPQHNLPRALAYAEELRRAGADVRVREFAPKEESELRADALAAVQRDLGDLTQSLDRRIRKGEAFLAEAQKLQDAGRTNKAIRFVRGYLAYIRRCLAASREAATAFGILADLDEYYAAFHNALSGATRQWCLEREYQKVPANGATT